MRTPLLLALSCLLLIAAPAQAQKLVRDYQFKETLKDSAEQGPELKSLNGNLGNGIYNFAAGNGLELEKAGVTDHYTIEITFRFDDQEGWQKVLDFKRGASDDGLYVYNGQLQFYNYGIGGDFQANTNYRVKLERDRTTKTVRGYINDVMAFEFQDDDGHGVLDNEAAVFFVDDPGTDGAESSGGAVTRIRIWDAPGGK